MEVVLMSAFIVIGFIYTWWMIEKQARQTTNLLGRLEFQISELTILLDNAKLIMQNVAAMEKRLADRDDVREHQRRLQEADWKSV